MTIEQTVEIPADRRIFLDVPVNAAPADDFDDYFGCFKGHELWNEGGVSAVRKLRDEW